MILNLPLNPYPTNSVCARIWDYWSAISEQGRSSFVRRCEASPPGAMHGAISVEWDVVSRMVSN